jgi:hypothetical protein
LKFWECIQNQEEPPELEVKIEREDILSSAGIVNMDRIDPQLWAELVKKYAEASAMADEAEAQKELSKQQIMNVMQTAGAEIAEGAGARIYWREQQGRKTLDKKAFLKGAPEAFRIYESFMNIGKPIKAFRFYPIRPLLKE